MASVLLTAAGAALGAGIPGVGFIAGPLLGLAGGTLGGFADSALGLTPSTSFTGSRLGSLRVQDSREGAPIARVYGTMRLAGNIIWSSPLIETTNTQRVGGGKGGSARATTYRYAAHIAVGICAGPVQAIHRIWADSKLIYDRAQNTVYTDAVRIYTGSATQTPDALIESFEGTGNAPAYRGTAYVVLENLKLEHYGNRIPNLTFEVEGFSSGYAPVALGSTTHTAGAADTDWNARRAITVSPTHVVVMGYTTAATFVAEHYTLNGSTFTLSHTSTSAVFTQSGTPNYGLSPNRTHVACALGTATDATVMVYDIAAQTFGAPTAIILSTTAFNSFQILWLDNATLVIPAANTGTLGVHLLRAAGTTVIADAPPPYITLFATGVLDQYVVNIQPTFALGTLIFCASSASADTFALARLSHAGGTIAAETFAPVTPAISGVGGGRHMVILPSAEILYINDGGSVWDISTYAITTTGLSVTRGSMQSLAAPAGVGIASLCALSASHVVALNADIGSGFKITELNLTDSAIEISGATALVNGAPAPASSPAHLSRFGGNTLLLLNDTQLMAFTARRGDNTLAAVVDDIAAQLGLAPAVIDTTDLATVRVAGFIIPSQQPARRALETLQAAYPFSITESDGVLRCQLLTTGSATNIPTATRRASADNTTPPTITTTRAQQADVPTAVQIDYIDAINDYATASAVAQRAAPPHNKVEQIGLPLALSAAAAQSIANATLARRVVEAERITFSMARDYVALDTNDRISVDGKTYRLTRTLQQGSIIKADAVRDDVSLLASVATLSGTSTISLNDDTLTTVYTFDLPALADSADQPGIYIGATAANGWLGGIVYRSLAGLPVAEYTRLPRSLTLGYATTALPAAPTDYTDNASTITIALAYGTLSSVTALEMLNGSNMALLGDEIIHFQNATLVAPNTYQLSTLLRGRHGTEYATTLHQTGERFVLLEASALQFVPTTLSDRNRSGTLQLLSSGQTLAEALATPFTYTLNTLKPLMPTHLAAVRDATSGDITLSWVRRARVNAEWSDSIDVPLDESTEGYAVEVDDGFGTTLRSFTPATATQTYTAAQQTADFGGLPAVLTFRVAQTSPRYGNGQIAQATISL